MNRNMAYSNAIITLALLFIPALECQKTCFLRDLQQLNVSCDVTSLNAKNVTWSLLDTKTNKTLIFNFCEATICHPLIPRMADSLFVATVTSDESGQYIRSSALAADVKYGDPAKLSMLKQLQCQYNDKIITVCDTLEAYVNPTKIRDDETYLYFNAHGLAVVVETDSIYPSLECTLYIDNKLVSHNSSVIKAQISDYKFEDDGRYGYCSFELNVTEIGRGIHQFQVKASAETTDQARDVLTTKVMSINFDSPMNVTTICTFPERLFGEVIVTCRSEVVSDSYGCEFEILTNGTSLRLVSVNKTRTKYADLLGVPMMITECKMALNEHNLSYGYYQFRARVLSYTKENLTRFSNEYTTPLLTPRVYFLGCTYKESIFPTVSCRTNLYRRAISCEYEVKTNGTLREVKGNITFAKDADNTVECAVTVNPRDLGLGYHQFRLILVAFDNNGDIIKIPFNFTSPILYDLPEIMVYTQQYNYELNGIKASCSMKHFGNPFGSFRWIFGMKNGTLNIGQSGQHKLFYSNLTLVDYMNISCEPLSLLMDNLPKTYVDLVPNQKEQILNFTANGYEHQFVTEIGKYVTLQCSGTQMRFIEFRQVGRYITMYTRSPYYTFNVTSCRDAGRYECSATQLYSTEKLESQIEIRIKCPLILKSGAVYAKEISAKINETIEIRIPVIGYPELNHYTLLRQSGKVAMEVTSGYNASYLQEDNPDGTIMLRLTDLQADAFTNYTLVFGNGIGSEQEFGFKLYKVKVDAPSQSLSVAKQMTIIGSVCGGVAVLMIIIGVIYHVKKNQKQKNVNLSRKDSFSFTSDSDMQKL